MRQPASGDIGACLREVPLWRPLKLYWKKLLYFSLMLLLPGGLWILGLCLVAYALNWGAEMQACQMKQFKKWTGEHHIHS
jgi:hypothetical protein